MDVNSGRVFLARDVKFDESTLYHQLLKTKPAKFAFEPAEQNKDSEIVDEPPKPKATAQPPQGYDTVPESHDTASESNSIASCDQSHRRLG